MSLNAGDFVPANELPLPMTICARHSSQVNFALSAWDNEDHDWEKYATVYDDFDDEGKQPAESRLRLITWQDLRVKIPSQPAGHGGKLHLASATSERLRFNHTAPRASSPLFREVQGSWSGRLQPQSGANGRHPRRTNNWPASRGVRCTEDASTRYFC